MLVSPDESGYTGAGLVKSWGGKGCLYIMPIQHVLDTSPLPFSAMEFSAMPKAKCVTCHQEVPLQLLSLHAETCCNNIEEVQLIASFSLLSITEHILMSLFIYSVRSLLCFCPLLSLCLSFYVTSCLPLFPSCLWSLYFLVPAMCSLFVVRVSTPHLFPIVTLFVCLICFSCVLLIPLVLFTRVMLSSSPFGI